MLKKKLKKKIFKNSFKSLPPGQRGVGPGLHGAPQLQQQGSLYHVQLPVGGAPYRLRLRRLPVSTIRLFDL